MPRSRAAATSPWNSPYAGRVVASKRGRPKKPPAEPKSAGCAWPVGATTCRATVQPGLAVCPKHAKILDQGPGKECAWPSCPQRGFKALCTYHDKLARGLLRPLR
jgi:hypothetical protein